MPGDFPGIVNTADPIGVTVDRAWYASTPNSIERAIVL